MEGISINSNKNIIHSFSRPLTSYGVGDSERCIEIPWAISQYKNEKVVLDIGYAHAEERYLKKLLDLHIPELHGLDIVDKNIDGIISHVSDIRKTEFFDDFFDLVFCISTIEHVGKDNKIYTGIISNQEKCGDIQALREIYRITKPGGKVVITVPYGKFHDYGWFIHYDKEKLHALTHSSPWQKSAESYYLYNNGWFNCGDKDLESILYKDNGAPAAAGLACIVLIKPSLKRNIFSLISRLGLKIK
ncbi:class I SAM-dependent methyltransferase [Methanomicrobium antiquum]|uniref:Class I SAM-dependent methyltransferase n=1 Tax=Methanomicrobium antiquum TaxID=487686 RepID=A0AAF0JMP9_9EURY|nr:methyltransferase domain-containing protein [Methanomicrobium antiquum]WFN36775.1 class I SAM-dependent methyltransferase [Methanomicrobium antiquum]